MKKLRLAAFFLCLLTLLLLPVTALAEVSDGAYTCEVTLTGGSGRASVTSPAEVIVEGGKMTATVVWSSKNYDYMEVDGVRYLPVQEEGNSTFVIPIVLDTDMAVSAETLAMSQPHVIDYTLRFDGRTLKSADSHPSVVLWVAVVVIVAAAIALRVWYIRKNGKKA